MLSAVQSRDAETISCLAGDDTDWEILTSGNKEARAESWYENQFRALLPAKMARGQSL